MTLALYARVSSDRQEREGTIASQIAALEAFAERLGLATQLYADDGWSGGSLERPGLARLRAALAAGVHEGVVVHDIDRLSRDQADLYQLVHKEIVGRGLPLWVAKTGARFEDTAEGDALFAMFAAFAKIERRRIGERARRGGKHRAAVEGRKNGGIPSFGFDLEDGRYVLNAGEVDWCRRMADWLVQGITPGLIAQRLTLHEVPTKYDSLRIVRTGSRRQPNFWHPDQVRRILTHRLYGGEWVYHAWDGTEVVVPVPAIFTADELDRHRRIIEQNTARKKRADGPAFILRGLIRCGSCGRRYVAGHSSGQRLYRCGIYNRPRQMRDCWNKGWTARRIETAVWDAVHDFLMDPRTALMAAWAAGEDTDRPELRIAQLERRLTQLDIEDARVRQGYREGVYEAAHVRVELERSERARRLLAHELDEIRTRASRQARMEGVERRAAQLREHLPHISHEAKGAILAELVPRVTVTGETVEIEIIVPTEETGQAVPSVGNRVVLRVGGAA